MGLPESTMPMMTGWSVTDVRRALAIDIRRLRERLVQALNCSLCDWGSNNGAVGSSPAVRRRSTDSAGRSTGVCPYHGRRHKSARRPSSTRRSIRPWRSFASPGNSRIKGNA